jgi:hypothetical protein
MTTLAEARDRVFTHFNTFWVAEVVSRAILPAAPYVVYQNVNFDPEKDVTGWPVPYAEVDVQHVTGGIASLGGSSRLFRREGIVIVQIHTLKGDKDTQGGTVLNDELAQVAMDAFDGKHLTGNIWFQDVFPVETGPDEDGQFFTTVVTAEFQYDDIK